MRLPSWRTSTKSTLTRRVSGAVCARRLSSALRSQWKLTFLFFCSETVRGEYSSQSVDCYSRAGGVPGARCSSAGGNELSDGGCATYLHRCFFRAHVSVFAQCSLRKLGRKRASWTPSLIGRESSRDRCMVCRLASRTCVRSSSHLSCDVRRGAKGNASQKST